MDWKEYYFALMDGLFCFFSMELFVSYNNNNHANIKKIRLRYCYLIFSLIYAYLPSSLFDIFWSSLSDFIYIYIFHNFKLKKALSSF